LEVVDDVPNGAKTAVPPDRSTEDQRGLTGSPVRFLLGLTVAAVADGLEVLFPLAWIPIDLATVGVFFLLWGFRWEVALVLLPELIPGVNVFPSWVLLALYLGGRGGKGQRAG
jgi:hypothetical protein